MPKELNEILEVVEQQFRKYTRQFMDSGYSDTTYYLGANDMLTDIFSEVIGFDQIKSIKNKIQKELGYELPTIEFSEIKEIYVRK